VYDAVIVGAGPAGLSAALVLGRCRRTVLVCDSGSYRNGASQGLHGFLTRDGTHPAELRRIGREQLAPYAVVIRRALVTDARREDDHFEVTLAGGERAWGRKLLLATGLVDKMPAIAGLEELYGTSVHHCPYCDGWEHRDKPIAVYGPGGSGLKLAHTLRRWTSDLVLCTDGPAQLSAEDAALLARHGVVVRTERIERLQGQNGRLERIVFGDGQSLARSAMFVKTGQAQRSDLAEKLGCVVSPEVGVQKEGKFEETNVKGVFVAGDASKDLLLAIVAASEGAKAAFRINCELQDEDLGLQSSE